MTAPTPTPTPPKEYKFRHAIAGSTFIPSHGRPLAFLATDKESGGVLTTKDPEIAAELRKAAEVNPQISAL